MLLNDLEEYMSLNDWETVDKTIFSLRSGETIVRVVERRRIYGGWMMLCTTLTKRGDDVGFFSTTPMDHVVDPRHEWEISYEKPIWVVASNEENSLEKDSVSHT